MLAIANIVAYFCGVSSELVSYTIPKMTNLEYYIANQTELLKKYEGKVLLIHDCKVHSTYEDKLKAAKVGIDTFEPGSFQVIKCTQCDSEYTARYYNWRVSFGGANG